MISIFCLAALGQNADIELNAHVTAQRVQITQRGSTSLRVSAEPDAGSAVDVSAPRLSEGVLQNVDISVKATARLAAPEPPKQGEKR